MNRRGVLIGLATSAATGLALPATARAPDRSLRPPPRPTARLPATATATAAAGGTGASVQPRPLEALLSRANLGGTTGFVALDTETGAVIEALEPDTPLPPASVAKAPTALYALHHLGLEHRFVTRIRARGGTIRDGVLAGDLVLQGGGDPVLQTADLAALAQMLVGLGLRRVEGRLIVDQTALPLIETIDPGQVPQAGYSPAIAGMNLNFNRVHFGWTVAGGQARLSMDARSPTEVPPVSVIRATTADRAHPVYTHARRDGVEHWTVARAALGGSGSRWLPVRQPGLYAGDVLRALLAARGCTVPAPVLGNPQGGVVLAEHRSPPLTTMMREMLRFSTNITAEAVGLAASARAGAVGDLAGSGARMGAWLGQRPGVPGMRFVDHSGLGDASRVTARQMAQLFRAARREGLLHDILRPHPMRDAQGRAVPNHPIAVRAKTGTLNFASGLGGYVRTPAGREIAFAIFSADLARRARIGDAERERPAGARDWSGRARALQQGLIERWAILNV